MLATWCLSSVSVRARTRVEFDVHRNGDIGSPASPSGPPTPQPEVPPTGQAFRIPFADFFRFPDRRVGEQHVYYDQLALVAAQAR
jgi:hypothetical protein